jgi:hypothetical protein
LHQRGGELILEPETGNWRLRTGRFRLPNRLPPVPSPSLPRILKILAQQARAGVLGALHIDILRQQ